MAERPFSQEAPRPLVVAHRGASATHAENTISAFDAAVVAGADAVEFDVRLTADGVPVVLHDADLARTTDASGTVREVTAAGLAAIAIPTPLGPLRVPTLRETLEALSGRVAIDVELKNVPGEPDFEPGASQLVAAVLESLEGAAFDGDVLVSSFDPVALDAVRRSAPDLATGLLTAHDVDPLAAVTFARDRGHPWVLPFAGALRVRADEVVSAAAKGGVRVGTWLTDDPAEAVGLFRAGVDAVATNDPTPVVAAVREAFGA